MTDGDEAQPKARKGRPAGKRGTFTFRVTAGLRARLEADAVAVGRPVSEEIEYRLEKSYSDVSVIQQYFGRPETVELACAISSLAERIEKDSGKRWSEDDYTARQLYDAINRIMYLYFEEHKKLKMDGGIAALLNKGLDPEKRNYFLGRSCADALSITMGLDTSVREQWEAFVRSQGAAAEKMSD